MRGTYAHYTFCNKTKKKWRFKKIFDNNFCNKNVSNSYVEIKCQLDATDVFIAELIVCSTCFGHHYAHHQELKSIIQWLLRVIFCAVVFSSSWSGVELRVMRPVCRTHNPQLQTRPATWKKHSTKYHTQQPLYNTLELLMMGIMMPETCWASNKICNKNLRCI